MIERTRTTIAPGYDIPRLIKGGWQLAGGHGAIDEVSAIAEMRTFALAGITAFDCADIYTGVEALIGQFLRRWRLEQGPNAPAIRVHTKCVPDLDRLASLQPTDITQLVERSRTRLGVDTIDLVQFHWWDYAIPGMIPAMQQLATLRGEGLLREVGVTNMDTPHLSALLDAGVPVVTHQVQVSLLDRRALRDMATLCRAHGVSLLAYGALAGGFLHERWHGVAAPSEPLENRSLVKYRLMIDEFGGWDRFQALLDHLYQMAAARETTIGAIALRAVLDEPDVAAVIVGARHAGHLPATLAALTLPAFTPAERATLRALQQDAPGPEGDVYTLERDRHGRHGAIMRYNLNRS